MIEGTHHITAEPTWKQKPLTSQSAVEQREPERFLSALHRQAEAADDGAEAALDAARDFVSNTLVKPILKQMREMNQAAPPFAPGPYEKAFAGMVDEQVADRIVRAQRFAIVDRIAATMTPQDSTHGPALSSGGVVA